MKYRIFVSDTESPENVKEFCVESEKPVEEIVKAAALQEVYDHYDAEDVEAIRFNAIGKQYGVIVVFNDMRLAVWCKNEPAAELTINPRFFDIASTVRNKCLIENKQLASLLYKVYDDE